MTTLVQELTEEGVYDLDADPAVEGANEATWLDADSVSPALARDVPIFYDVAVKTVETVPGMAPRGSVASPQAKSPRA